MQAQEQAPRMDVFDIEMVERRIEPDPAELMWQAGWKMARLLRSEWPERCVRGNMLCDCAEQRG
jgi:hypothetical protein